MLWRQLIAWLRTRPVSGGSGDREQAHDTRGAFSALRSVILVGSIGIVVYALQGQGLVGFISIASVGVMVAGATLLIGLLVGFLFGIPRSLARGDVPVDGERAGSTGEGTPQRGYRPNTNLEQISDWLTTILVGIGLTQLGAIADSLRQLTAFLAPGLGGSSSSSVFALALLLYFGVCGFLLGYLWARLILPGAFRQADLSAVRHQAEQEALSTAAALLRQQDQQTQSATVQGTAAEQEPRATRFPSVLWVDDSPANNVRERQSLEDILKARFTISTSTEDALERLAKAPGQYQAVISDMSRPPDRMAGYTLLEAMRKQGINIPVIFYTSSNRPVHKEEARRRGAFGQTSSPQELLQLLAEAVRS